MSCILHPIDARELQLKDAMLGVKIAEITVPYSRQIAVRSELDSTELGQSVFTRLRTKPDMGNLCLNADFT